jgi:hypothetical protein
MNRVCVRAGSRQRLRPERTLEAAGAHSIPLVVIIERADGIRPGGQTVDLRDAERAVVERMGLLD